jgi:hypothetical protein
VLGLGDVCCWKRAWEGHGQYISKEKHGELTVASDNFEYSKLKISIQKIRVWNINAQNDGLNANSLIGQQLPLLAAKNFSLKRVQSASCQFSVNSPEMLTDLYQTA